MSESQTNTGTELSRIDPATMGAISPKYDQHAAITNLTNGHSQAVAHNFNVSSEEGQLQLLAAQLADPQSIWKKAINSAEITNVIVSQFEVIDKDDGEVIDKLRTLFVCKDGTIVSSNSPACARFALQLLQSPIGRETIDPPLPVKFERVQTTNGGTALTAVVDPKEILGRIEQAAKKAKKK